MTFHPKTNLSGLCAVIGFMCSQLYSWVGLVYKPKFISNDDTYEFTETDLTAEDDILTFFCYFL